MTKTILGLAAAGLIASIAPSFAGNGGTVVNLSCALGAKEFAGPVEVKNTTGGMLKKGTKINVVAFTAYGKEYETITLSKDLAVGAPVKGSKMYQNVSTGCQASVTYPKIKITPRA